MRIIPNAAPRRRGCAHAPRFTSSLLFATLCCAVLGSPVSTAAQRSISEGPQETEGAYKLGLDESIRFKALLVRTNNDADLNAIVQRVTSEPGTHVWRGSQRYVTLPDNEAKYWLICWKNLTRGEYGWVLIHNTPKTWWYKTNSHGYEAIGSNGESASAFWTSNGARITVFMKNPINENGFTGNDIIYRIQ